LKWLGSLVTVLRKIRSNGEGSVMGQGLIGRWAFMAVATVMTLAGTASIAAPSHGIAMYGEPALPPDFVALPYANPDAPKGGDIVLGEAGTFDSLNPFILKGTAADRRQRAYTVETLMARSIDEPFTLYGLSGRIG
jgi:peptide/nickel transport system substrate-binding protein